MKIVQVSDCHLYAEPSTEGYAQLRPYQTLYRVLAKAKETDPELVIVSGDISSDGSLRSYQHFSKLWQASKLKAKLIVMPGNHDDVNVMQAHFPSSQLSLGGMIEQRDNWQLHSLNSKFPRSTTKESRGQVSKGDLLSLASSISKAPDLSHLVVVHHHPINCEGWMDVHEWTNRQDFVALVAAFPQIKAVIYGHIHHASEQQRGDCVFMSCPSSCWQWATGTTFATSQASPGFRVIKLNEYGHLSSQIIRI